MDRSNMLKFMHKLNKIIIYFNKYIYILPILSILSTLKNNKFFNRINTLIKILILINIVFGVAITIYLIDFNTPINHTYSIYSDLLEPYIEIIKHLWNKIISYFNNLFKLNDSTSSIKDELSSVLKESTSQVKTSVKDGVKEALTEILDEMNDDPSISINLKTIALYSSILFFTYFLFYLPINPNDLTQYNWINQSLIELKITIKDLIINLLSNSTNPGTPPQAPATGLPNLPSPISPTSSNGTITLSNYMKEVRDVGTQTLIDGKSVGRMVETVNILGDSLKPSESSQIFKHVDKVIKKITD